MHIKDFDPYDFSKKTIDGVDVYYKNLPWAPCINIRIVFNSGAFDDPIGKEGLSHFVEHLIHDGSPLLPDKKAIREWSKINALNMHNAWTSFYNTTYWLKCLPEKYNEVLRGMKDMIFSSHLRAEDVEHERKVITQEAWGRFLNDKFLLYAKELMDNLFHGHAHSRFYSPLGWPETIAKISQEDIKSWHKNHYGTGNFFIVLTGAVEESHIEALRDFLKGIPRVKKEHRNDGITSKPKNNRFIKSADEIGEVKEQVEISISRIAEKIPYTREEVKNLLSRLISDLLHERLRIEHSLCYNVNAGIENTNAYSSAFITVKTDEKNIKLVEQEYQNILKEIKSEKYNGRFDLIKKVYSEQVKSREILSADIADITLREISRFDGHIVTQKEQLEAIEKVTYDDIVKFTKWAFDPEYTYTEIILPSKK